MEDSQFFFNDVKALHLGTLVGHNGSIFRIAWSSDGSKLLSVSDDRRWVSCFVAPKKKLILKGFM